MAGVGMARGFCAAKAMSNCATKASLAASLGNTITPGLVQNWPQPREIEPASVAANSAPRAVRMPGSAATGRAGESASGDGRVLHQAHANV